MAAIAHADSLVELRGRVNAACGCRLDWRWSDGDHSAYASVEPQNGLWGATLRISDHPQKLGGGWNERRGERMGDASLSFVASVMLPTVDEIYNALRAFWLSAN